jgi:hypothetical protein
MSWGSPPGRQALPPFGSPMLRTPPLRPTTFMPPTVRQAYVNIGFVYLLDYFIFLTHAFTCILGRLRITTRRRAGIRLHRRPLQHDGRIWRQRRDAVVLVLLAVVSVLLSLIVNYIILSCRTYFTYVCRKLHCGFAVVYDYSYIFYLFWRLPVQGGNENSQ